MSKERTVESSRHGVKFPQAAPKSVLIRRVLFQTLASALWRINAGHIQQLHRRVTAGVEPSSST
jgi:hypothetical protein